MPRRSTDVPEPPPGLPEGRVINIPGSGETLVRDTGGDGPVVLLLHGWMFPADLNWFPVYRPLSDAGYRVLALDHRGHGRGIRSPAPFRLEDCARDAAGLLETLGVTRAVVAGYSMGGPIAALLARQAPERVQGVVFCATSQDWQDAYMKPFWRTMAFLRLMLGLAPQRFYRGLLRLGRFGDTPRTTWFSSELSRGSARDLAEAGRELARFDARPWIGALQAPAAVVITTKDRSVPPRKQRALAEATRAEVFEVRGDHFAVAEREEEFRAALLGAIAAVSPSVHLQSVS